MSDANRRGGVSRSEGRGAGAGRSSLRSSFRESGTVNISLADVAKVHRAADLVRTKAERHHEKHRNALVAKAYTKLLLKSGPTLHLTPPGMASDPKAAMLARAGREVAQTQARRLTRIDTARYALIATGKLRASRDLEWGGKARTAQAFVEDRPPAASADRAANREQRTQHAKIATAQDRARRRAEAHLVKHQDRWTGKRYDQFIARFGVTDGKAPQWSVQHIRDVAMDVANRDVKAKHEVRLQRIDQAAERMRASGAVRESRPAGRNISLER